MRIFERIIIQQYYILKQYETHFYIFYSRHFIAANSI